jgi:hypothetical protein
MAIDLGGEKRDEHAGVRAGDDTTSASLATCKKTMHPDEDSHAQRKSTTAPEKQTRGIDHDQPLPPCPRQIGGNHLALQSVNWEKQERKHRHAGDAGNTTDDNPNTASKPSY